MKTGAESRWKVIAMVVLALVAVGTFANMLIGFAGSPQGARATGTKTDTAYDQLFGSQQKRRATRRGPVVAQQSPDPTVRLDLLKAAEETTYEGGKRNPFRAEPDLPGPVESARVNGGENTGQRPPAPPERPQPVILLKFFGFASRPGEPKKVFLSQGEDVFIAGEGDIVNRRYRVLKIGANTVDVEDMLNNHQQTLPLIES